MIYKKTGNARRLILSMVLIVAITVGAININLLFAPANNMAYAAVSDDELIFKYLAPRSQTTYKEVFKSSRTAKSITKEGNKLKADGNTVTAFGAVIVPFHTIIGGVVAAAGGVTYLIGDYQVRSMSTVKENTNCVIKMDFKWTYTKSYPLKGTFRIKSYYTYKGKTVGEVKTYYQNRQFALGERW